MQALVREADSVQLRPFPRPALMYPDDVLIQVRTAGICRTDLAVAQGEIPVRAPLVLGHEFAGEVAAVGAAVRDFQSGERVTVMPWIACRHCRECRDGFPEVCQQAQMLGLDRHGAFAETICVPQGVVYALPPALSWQAGAYCEPVAASLAVLKAGLSPSDQGAIAGHNRIALLTQRVLAARGLSGLRLGTEGLPDNSLDFAIETQASGGSLAELLRVVRPRGKVILKSRGLQPTELPVGLAVRKEISLLAAHYGSFTEALALLASGLDTADLWGESYPLADFAAAFAAGASEASKIFLTFPA